MKQQYIDTLNELLKGELMAIQVYDKTKEIQGDAQVQEMLDKFKKDHKRHTDLLTQRIKELGGIPENKTGFPGIMSDVTAMVNSIRGPKHLLKQVYDGEDKGINAYEERLEKLDPVSQYVVRGIMQEDHEHLKFFKERMEKEKSENIH
jgi:bacterioferritin (cytochrome b1)